MGAEKDIWDKWDIVLKPLGGLITAAVVAYVSFVGTNYLAKKQATESKVRLYAELMSNREKADSDLRREMFNSIIEAFLIKKDLDDSTARIEKKILALELLAYNFHDALDIGPLFKHTLKEIGNSSEKNDLKKTLTDRLERVAREVSDKQLAALAGNGMLLKKNVHFAELEKGIARLFYGEINLNPVDTNNDENEDTPDVRLFRLEVHSHNMEKKELRVQLAVQNKKSDGEFELEIDNIFKLGFFDFPVIDNTRLSNGKRIALVLTNWGETSAKLAMIVFPGSRASLKEKPYYDEVIQELIHTRNTVEK